MATVTPDPLAMLAEQLDPPVSPYLTDPAGWMRDRLGAFAWSKQREILQSIIDHPRTAVASAHDLGKSYIAATAGAWWTDVHLPHEDSFVASTAPTYKQVHSILWEEIRKAHRKSRERVREGAQETALPGQVTLADVWKIGELEVGYGRKPADTDEHGFQGIHRRYVLAILDEACGVPGQLWNAVEAITTNAHCRILAIGNPDDASTEFAKVCDPGSGYNVIHLDGLRSPNFTAEAIAGLPGVRRLMAEEGIEPSTERVPEYLRALLLDPHWVEDKIRRWGPKSPLFKSKVRGHFSELGVETLINPSLIRAAQERELPGMGHGVYGLDVARFGTDSTVIYRNRDGVVRKVYEGHRQDTMTTSGAAARILEPHLGAVPMVVDTIGVGAGVYDRLRELDYPVVSFDAGARPVQPQIPGREKFANRRAEAWWAVRLAFEAGEVDLDPDDDDLAAQLGSLRWWLDSKGVIHIESKEEWRKRMGAGTNSPDHADACMQSFIHAEPHRREPPRPAEAETLTADLLEREL